MIKRKKLTVLLLVCCLPLLCSQVVEATTATQKIGFKDVKFTSLTEKICRECHDAPDHHNTPNAVSGDCWTCHKVSTDPANAGVAIERDCMVCHEKSPHHQTEAAKNKECTSCHSTPGLSDWSTEVPAYKESGITPTSDRCKICHDAGNVEGLEIVDVRTSHHSIKLGSCSICHEENNTNSKKIRNCERCHNVKSLHQVIPHLEKASCIACHGKKTN